MKVLAFQGGKDEDFLWFNFRGVFDQQAALEGELDTFLQVLEQYAGEWMPDVVDGKRRRKYTRAAFWKSLEEARRDRGVTLGLYRTKWPALDMTFRLWFPPLPPKLDITVRLKPLSFFEDAERCRRFVDMVRAWATRYPTVHAVAHSSDDVFLTDYPRFGRDDETQRREGFDQIYEVFWLNVFGPKLVETVGRDRMASTPAHRLEELPGGAFLLVLRPTVADFASEEAREAQARAQVHLRPRLDDATVRRTLRERSALLAPVEPRFHPDLAPLLSRVVDRVASYERSRKIVEFNAWQPPEPEEWRPASASLPTDVTDPERSLALYGRVAEYLVALLHTQVPSVFEAAPESLADVDFYFWREEFPTSRPRQAIEEIAVPAIGAYLGRVLVRHLGGEWIHRRDLFETQVRVGSRVWFPFVRAHRYMRSRQSLLDASLIGLYRVAERHRS